MNAVMNYTTSIPADKTIAEMQKALAKAGAAGVSVQYRDGVAYAIGFQMATVIGERTFMLPVDIDAMSALMVKEWDAGRIRAIPKAKAASAEQAERVAWRVMKDWLNAQLTLVASSMASMDQVMLPYLYDPQRGQSLYSAFKSQELLALESGGR